MNRHNVRAAALWSVTFLIISLSILLPGGIAAQSTTLAGLGGWRIAGRDLNNSRSQRSDRQIDSSNVANLAVKWTFTTGGDVSATPTVAGNAVYFPDWGGHLFAVDRKSTR